MQPAPFRIKICGITSVADALAAVDAGADAIGLNFYPGSSRYVEPLVAEQIVTAIPKSVVKVGVFVDAPPEQVASLAGHLGLNFVQLHGDEPATDMRDLKGLGLLRGFEVLKAYRCGERGLLDVWIHLGECGCLQSSPRAVLLDSSTKGHYGGTGKTFDWNLALEYTRGKNSPPLVLAGGLTAFNVNEAIRTVRPAAVDTASGVESSPGHKDPEKMVHFVAQAQAGFAEIGL